MATSRGRPTGTSESRFHEGWLGMVEQDGLVVSVPVLTRAGLMHQRGAGAQQTYRELLRPDPESADAALDAPPLQLASLAALLHDLLELTPGDVDRGEDLPEALHVVATESTTNTLLRPTAALRRTPRPTSPAAKRRDDPFADGENDSDSDSDSASASASPNEDPFADDDDDPFADDPPGAERPEADDPGRSATRPAAARAAPSPKRALADDPFADGTDDDPFADDPFDDADDAPDEATPDTKRSDASNPDADTTDVDTADDDPFDDDDDADDDDDDNADSSGDDPQDDAPGTTPQETPTDTADTDPELSTAARVGRDYLALVWDLADPDTGFGPQALGRPFDRPDQDAEWSYPPAAKFERLLRHTRVPIGLLTNRRQVRLIYAPHGETAGALTFDLDDMGEVGGRPMLDAFLALLSRDRWLTQAEERRLPALLEASRKQQAEVTERLADQVFDALQALLQGFEAAANRDGSDLLRRRVEEGRRSHGTGEVYAGLLTVLLRLVFTLYAEDRGLLPVEHPIYQAGYSVLGLFDELQRDQGAHPDAMDRRFGAWSRLVATWRAIYDGVHHHGHGAPDPDPDPDPDATNTPGDDANPPAEAEPSGAAPLLMPPRRGHLFNPDAYPFLEGRPEPAPLGSLAERAAVAVPSVDDGTIFAILDGLLYLREGKARQRLSYRALDVEQIGSVYEALMGYDVLRLGSAAVRLRARRAKGVWLSAAELLAIAPSRRGKWLKEEVGLDKAHGAKLAKAVAKALKAAALKPTDTSEAAAQLTLGVLADNAGKGYGQRAEAGRLVIQPGDERKRTSSHYTPRELTEPVVRRTLAPLLRTMEAKAGAPPSSEALLSLKIVDPAVGSGAFLVEVVRQLADHVVAAWQREGRYEAQGALLSATLGGLSPEARPSDGSDEQADPVIAARRLVAQRCVYGVDKNPYAVNLAKLSLWLVTLSRHLPFTFVDHALRCGDSLVGLSLAQARAFDWRVRDDLEFGEGAGSGKGGKRTASKAAKGGKKAKKAAKGPAAADPLLSQIVAASLERATELRRKIVLLANQDGEQAVLEREALLGRARAALDDARLLADLCLGAFFAKDKDKARLAERQRRFDLVLAWLGKRDREEDAEGAAKARAELVGLRDAFVSGGGGGQAPFHWMLEFPEVFWEKRVGPLADGKSGVAYFDAVVGNPPFMGGTDISARTGTDYTQWLYDLFTPARNRTDLCAYFLRQASRLLGPHGCLGLVTTNTIGQGDTREGGLAYEIAVSGIIFDATVDLMWPAPGAAVTVSVVHIAYGSPSSVIKDLLLRLPRGGAGAHTARVTLNINSRLAPRPERADPVRLGSNKGLCFLGSKIYGQGFLLSPADKEETSVEDPYSNIVKPYLGGAEVNTNPDQGFDRYVIDFGSRSLEQASRWPRLLGILRYNVLPERQAQTGRGNDARRLREFWWQFFRPAPQLYAAISRQKRCIVTAAVSKHALFSWQPTDRCFSHKLLAFPLIHDGALALLQSRVHAHWCWALSSTLETRLNYSPSDCFQNFPFPSPDPRTEHPRLEPLGARLDALRSAFMLDHQVGLTITYNLLLGFDTEAAIADPDHKLHGPATDPRLAELRQLHLELDRAVLDTYAERLAASEDPDERALAPLFAAENIAIPPYRDPRLPDLTPAERSALETFNDAVLDALMALNEVRAAQERGAMAKPAKGAKKAAKAKAGKPGKPAKPDKPDKAGAKPKKTPSAKRAAKGDA